jgi:hypothetical protein
VLQASADAAQSEELEKQALNAPMEPSKPSVLERSAFSAPIVALIVTVFILLFLGMR